jgi:hypothetical protein
MGSRGTQRRCCYVGHEAHNPPIPHAEAGNFPAALIAAQLWSWELGLEASDFASAPQSATSRRSATLLTYVVKNLAAVIINSLAGVAVPSDPKAVKTRRLHARRASLPVVKAYAIAPLLAENNDFVLTRQPAEGPIENWSFCTYLLFQAGQRQFAIVIECLPDCSRSRANFFVHLRPQRSERHRPRSCLRLWCKPRSNRADKRSLA